MPRERLTPLDASFLYLDGTVTCNQGVGLNLVKGRIDYERVVEEMQRKVRYVDRMRQCAVSTPLNLFHPTWEFDPEFDIRNHVKNVEIYPPGDEVQYKEAVERIYSTPLDRRHPLWAVYVVNGAPNGCSAYVVVIHHCVSDGVGFEKLAVAFYDAEPEMRLEAWDPPKKRPLPSSATRLGRGFLDAVRTTPQSIAQFTHGIAAMVAGFTNSQGRAAREMLRTFRNARSVRFPHNAPLTGAASYALAAFSMDELATIRAMNGGTLNDVLLAMTGTALHRYAERHGIATDGAYLRVLVPSNVRTSDTRDKFGNFVSMAPVLVPLWNCTTLERLAAVTAYTRRMKESRLAQTVSIGIALTQWILTPPLSRLAHQSYASVKRQQRDAARGKPLRFNLVVTNVPGAPNPLYVAGKELLTAHVLVPLLPSVGLCCGALSHNGTLFVSFTGDKATVPDVSVLADYLNGAFNELIASDTNEPA